MNNLKGFTAFSLFWMTAAAGALAAGADRTTGQLIEDFTYGSLALSPVTATQVGYHRHNDRNLDDVVDDYSPAGIESMRRFYARFQHRLDAAAGGTLDAEQHADLELMRNAVGDAQLEWGEIQGYRHNPTLYVELIGNALYTPYVLHYAPAAERFQHIIQRLTRVPELVRQAKANLADSPEIWNRVAREENSGNIDLIDKTLRADCPQPLKDRYASAASGALAALRDLNRWLETDLAKKTSDWRLGKERYAKKFRYELAIGKPPEQLLAEAEADLRRVRAEMAALVAPKTVEQALAEVASEHATPETFIASAKATLAEATAFVKAHDLLALPTRGNLQVVETPEFLRGGYAVGGFSPAPPLQPELGAYYWVTPFDKDMPRARIDSKLREYSSSGMQHLTVHEAMPGHYVQFEYANDVEPRSRRLLRGVFANTPYVEGWGVYAQQLMAEQGYRAGTPGYRLIMQKQLLRILANTILDVRLQTRGMTDEQAIEFMMKNAFQEQEEAALKLQRAKLSSCQLATYYAGFTGWLAARDHYKARKGAGFKLKEFHERALQESGVPLPLLDRLLQ